MKAKFLKNALDHVPDDAEITVASDDLGCEWPIEHFRYFPENKCVWLLLSDEPESDTKWDQTTGEYLEDDTEELDRHAGEGGRIPPDPEDGPNYSKAADSAIDVDFVPIPDDEVPWEESPADAKQKITGVRYV